MKMGALLSIYGLILSYMIHLYKYPMECMYLRKRKIISVEQKSEIRVYYIMRIQTQLAKVKV